MRRPFALTAILAVAAGTLTYAFSDDTEPSPADEQNDGGEKEILARPKDEARRARS
jgi:hypothetical protein